MMHAALPAPRSRLAPIALPPVAPDTYLKLRRIAAGLSVHEVARRMTGGFTPGQRSVSAIRSDDHAGATLLIEHLETSGMVALHRSTIDALAKAYPFDVDVYWQLRDLRGMPADRQPRICRGCGCSEYDACVAADLSHSCAWAGPATCTRCAATPSVPVHQ